MARIDQEVAFEKKQLAERCSDYERGSAGGDPAGGYLTSAITQASRYLDALIRSKTMVPAGDAAQMAKLDALILDLAGAVEVAQGVRSRHFE